MKCGILTLHNALNYGAFLQAFALKSVMEKEIGVPTNIINLSRNSLIERIMLIKSRYPKRIIHHYRFLKEFDKVSSCLDISNNAVKEYDVIIVGSDELWNLENGSFKHYKQYFGHGLDNKLIISYAVSSNKVTPERFLELTNKSEDFSSFNSISVRDQNTQNIVKIIGNREAKIVVDPTLLIDDWKRYIVPCKEKNFILLYSMTVYEDEKRAIRKLASETGKKIITIGCYNPWCDKSVYATPFEFLGYVQAADYVITSQFHGVMFSIIFNKQFVIQPQNKVKVLDAMEKFELNDRDVSGKEDLLQILQKEINYKHINSLVDNYRHESLEWLNEALKEITISR